MAAETMLENPHGNLRTCVLASLTLCVLTITFSVLRYPTLLAGRWLIYSWIVFIVLSGAYASLRWTDPTTANDAIALRLGTRWGVAIGGLWIASLIGENIVIPHEIGGGVGALLAVVAFVFQFVPGVHGAIKIGKI